ncbi:hypothetical protein [Ammoniphilus resinae]|uniref:Uncharacterized protein n=1 Tax=Ammoniphilus resinae TaxID=861532 RepID=A0ABS4GXS6_9BACL|nr:hypothetical protein [Ammoniphilus resinae]MBP1935072.1 hypothetical protein [Ammoniphilus resinae]
MKDKSRKKNARKGLHQRYEKFSTIMTSGFCPISLKLPLLSWNLVISFILELSHFFTLEGFSGYLKLTNKAYAVSNTNAAPKHTFHSLTKIQALGFFAPMLRL